MRIKNVLFLILSLSVSQIVFSQSSPILKDSLICRTWRLEKYKETDGKVYNAPLSAKNEYLKYNCDGTFESIEMGITILGKWFLMIQHVLLQQYNQ